MNAKRYGIGIALLLLVLITLLFVMRDSNSGRSDEVNPDRPPTLLPNAQDVPILLTGVNGEQFAAKNFIASSTKVESNSGVYYDIVHSDPSYAGGEGTSFEIQFSENDDHFIILLTQEPLSQARASAEQFLYNTLGIPTEQICQLSVEVFVATQTNTAFADKGSLGLSFCPGAVPLP